MSVPVPNVAPVQAAPALEMVPVPRDLLEQVVRLFEGVQESVVTVHESCQTAIDVIKKHIANA